MTRGNVAAIEPFNHSPYADKTKSQPTTILNKNFNKSSLLQMGHNSEISVMQIDTSGTGQFKQTMSVPESDETKLARQKMINNDTNLRGQHFEDKKSEMFQFPHKNKFTDKVNECDSEKEQTLDTKTMTHLIKTQMPIPKSENTQLTLSSKSSDEKENVVGIKPKHTQIPMGNLIVTPRKPISTVAPTLVPKHLPKVHIVQPILGQDKSSPRPVLPPKPNKSQSLFEQFESQQSSSSTTTATTSIDNNSIKTDNLMNKPESIEDNIKIHETGTDLNLLDNLPIKPKPLTIKKQPFHEQPKLKSFTSGIKPIQYSSRRIEIPPSFLFPEIATVELKDKSTANESSSSNNTDEPDKAPTTQNIKIEETLKSNTKESDNVVRRIRDISLADKNKNKLARRVSFDPLALLLDASLEGELDLVKKTAVQVPNPSAANDEGITALHNAICAGHIEIVKFLVEFGCDVNAQDSDGWTPLHCAASCNNLSMVKFLVESGACLFAATLSDHETPAEKCEEDEEGFDGCSEYLYSKLL